MAGTSKEPYGFGFTIRHIISAYPTSDMPESLYLYQAVTIDDAIMDCLRRQYLATGISLMYFSQIRANILRNYDIRHPTLDMSASIKDALNRLCHLRVGGIKRQYSSSYDLLSSEEENSINWRLCSDSKILKATNMPESNHSFGRKRHDLKSSYLQEKKRQEQTTADKKNKESDSVYYVQWENQQEFVKIGYSKSPAKRIASFLTGNPGKLIVLRIENINSILDEKARHNYFSAYHYTREWFYYQGELREYIQELNCQPAIDIMNQIPSAVAKDIAVEYF